MQDLAARLRDLPIEVFSVPEPDEAWARGALADLSDRALLEVTARAIERPKQSASSSFVLHAPLELVARARLLPSVSPSTRGPARRRIAEIGARYAASGPEADLTDHTYPDAGAAFTDLEAALAAGDPTRADAAIGFLGAAMDPGDLATSLTDVVVPALGAAAHAPILLAGALTSSEGRDMFPRLIRAPIRYLAMDWTRRLTWMRRSPVLAPEQEGLVETLLAAPRVTSTSMSIAPTMLAVEADGLAQRLLAGPTTRLSPAEAERALLESEKQFKLLVQIVADYVIYMLDLEGRVTSWNAGAQRIKGYLPDEIIGEHFSRFFTEEDRQHGVPQAALRVAARDGRSAAEGWRVRKNGTRFWANVVVHPIRAAAGVLIGFATVTRDATDEREAQIALGEAREALFQSQKMEAIGRLAAGVAHDFNNILQGIIGGLELVLDEVADATPAQKFTEVAINAAMRGSSLTHGLLSYARKQMLRPQPIALAPFLADMEKLLARTLGPHIRIKVNADRTASVLADPGQLQTALLNLAINASHAMPLGGVLTMEAREESEAGQLWVALSVTDTGTGMDEATLARAVEPFFTTKGLNGTGLGLSMVQGFAEQSGGRFHISSAPGHGTMVELRLPSAVPENGPE